MQDEMTLDRRLMLSGMLAATLPVATSSAIAQENTAEETDGNYVSVNGIRVHYLRYRATRPPIVLLHGWPAYSEEWRPVMDRLRGRFDLIAPDLRNFGKSDKPAGDEPAANCGPDILAADLLAFADRLGLKTFGIVSHDVGAYVAQTFARQHPERLSGLFFFNCPYNGIGNRWADAPHLLQTWYQYFNQQPFAAKLVGSSREACRHYIGHFLKAWSAGNPAAFDVVVEQWVDNFMRPHNLQGGFNWYISTNPGRQATIQGRASAVPVIRTPTKFFWGRLDPSIKAEWTDRLDEFFSDFDLSFCEDGGHFVNYERPDAASREIQTFFEGSRVNWKSVDA
ncbi:alpha/beta hydrolase [Sandaracinobacter sp. RS1-74]|uniref:alpha/beta fold hydrolase n=1 Tax=Sandaracinobacteroides sayramensis TaxID=2913411 RepID=UPI001EDBE5E9|nr:alpha/beta hydrolase [Sandaracinobacteroides sayramensis]MCG2842251.1 alpha/beta hydrolase [Sandaracinobacteroides sayramensis]